MLTESSQSSRTSLTMRTKTYVLCFRSWFCKDRGNPSTCSSLLTFDKPKAKRSPQILQLNGLRSPSRRPREEKSKCRRSVRSGATRTPLGGVPGIFGAVVCLYCSGLHYIIRLFLSPLHCYQFIGSSKTLQTPSNVSQFPNSER